MLACFILFRRKLKILVEKDYIIVGAGIAGVSLALELDQRDCSLVVFDQQTGPTASGIAAGLINPIVPRRVIPAWNAGRIFPGIEAYYSKFAEVTGVSCFRPMPMYQFHKSAAESEMWQMQSATEENKLFLEWKEHSPFPELDTPFGCSLIHLSGRLHVQNFCKSGLNYISAKHEIKNEPFHPAELHISETGVSYRGIHAQAIIFCEGVAANENPFFGSLPVKKTWGDILRIHCPELKTDEAIIKQKYWLIPVGNGEYFTGSNFIHEPGNAESQKKDVQQIVSQLRSWLPEFEVLETLRAARPTVPDRRPIMGRHPQHKNIYIYNGLGTRGCSLITWLSPRMADYITANEPLPEEVLLNRYFY